MTLGVQQNISTAYHPQTDGQSERTNQTMENLLRIFCNHQQDDWVEWLPIVQYIINSRPSSTTKKAPYEPWIGYTPLAHQAKVINKAPALLQRKEELTKAREVAQKAMIEAQNTWVKLTSY